MKRSRIRRKACRLAVSFIAVAFALPHAALATTVSDFSVEDLVRYSHAGVRVRVLSTSPLDEHLRHRLEVVEVLFGNVPRPEIELDLLGSVEGMPVLNPGDEVVVFLNFDNRIERVIGLKWGTYRIRDEVVFTHDWRGQRLVPELRAAETLTFLRALPPDNPGSISYDAFQRHIREVYRHFTLRDPAGGTGR